MRAVSVADVGLVNRNSAGLGLRVVAQRRRARRRRRTTPRCPWPGRRRSATSGPSGRPARVTVSVSCARPRSWVWPAAVASEVDRQRISKVAGRRLGHVDDEAPAGAVAQAGAHDALAGGEGEARGDGDLAGAAGEVGGPGAGGPGRRDGDRRARGAGRAVWPSSVVGGRRGADDDDLGLGLAGGRVADRAGPAGAVGGRRCCAARRRRRACPCPGRRRRRGRCRRSRRSRWGTTPWRSPCWRRGRRGGSRPWSRRAGGSEPVPVGGDGSTVAVMVTTRVVPAATVPRAQVTSAPARVQVPAAVADAGVRRAGGQRVGDHDVAGEAGSGVARR